MAQFRREVIQRFLDRGFSVSIIAPEEANMESLNRLPKGINYIPVQMDRTSTSPFHDMKLFVNIFRILRKLKPCHVFNYTIKPNIYGALAARMLGISSTDMIAGLGYSFTSKGIPSKIARTLYRVACHCANQVVVLNQANYDTVLSLNLCKQDKLHLLRGGEGCDLSRYPLHENASDATVFVLIGRLVEEKGYNEFVAVARRIKNDTRNVTFQVVGGFDNSYPRHINEEQVQKDVQEGVIDFRGRISNMDEIYGQRGVVVCVPSYYSEGLNRSLIEGCASGKPIITTDWPGCRETVQEGVNGYLAEPRDVDSLENAIRKYLSLSCEEKLAFGMASRKLALDRFDVNEVVEYYESLLPKPVVGGVICKLQPNAVAPDYAERRAA